jgi:hypothetical protein
MGESSGIDSLLGGWAMPKACSGDMRQRVIAEVESGTSRDEPHPLIEGCLLASFAIRAHVCYIYIRGEFVRERVIAQLFATFFSSLPFGR